MNRCVSVAAVVLLWMSSAMWAAPQAAGPRNQPGQPASADAGSVPEYRAVLDRYCVTCHNERAKAGGLMLDKVDLSNISGAISGAISGNAISGNAISGNAISGNTVPSSAEVLEKVVRKVRVGMMPPQGAPRPDPDTQHALVAWLTTHARPRRARRIPIRAAGLLHRLNRAEYANAIRDLLALDVDTSSLLPPDDSAYGFDNIADALGVSPVLLERYLTAADKISSLAIGDPEIAAGRARRSAFARTRRRTPTSKAFRLEPSAACSRRRRFRSMANTTFRSGCSGPTWA